MKALEEIIHGKELEDELLALEILQLLVGVGHTRVQDRALQAVVATPKLAVRQDERPIAFAEAVTDHGHMGTRAVDVAALFEKVAGSVQGAEVDDGAWAVLHAEDGAILLVQLSMSEPRVALRHLENVTNEWKAQRTRW